MNASKTLLAGALTAGLLAASCGGPAGSRAPQGNFISIGEPVMIDNFAYEGELPEIDSRAWDAIGLKSIKVVDSLVVISHGSSWGVYSPDGVSYGNALSCGQGPEEFSSLPASAAAAYATEGDSLVAYIPDKDKGRVMRWNITAFVNDGRTIIAPAFHSDRLENSVWYVVSCDSTRFLEAVPTDNFDGFIRMMCNGDSAVEPPVTKALSQASVANDMDINLLAKVFRFDSKANMAVEGMLYMNQLNIFDGDGAEGKTLCVGKRPDELADIEACPLAERINTYISVCAWPGGFAGAYSGLTELAIQTTDTGGSELQFFDWQGTPLARVKMVDRVSCFDMDFQTGTLYVVTARDELKLYDASPVVALYARGR